MDINLNDAISKIDKILKTGQIFNVVGGEIFFCICIVPNGSVDNINQVNEFDGRVGKHFEKNFNTRFTSMVVDIKVKPVSVEVVGVTKSKSIESKLKQNYWTNPSFIYLDNNSSSGASAGDNNDEDQVEKLIYVRLYSLPKEWSSSHTSSFSHSHAHSHTHDDASFTHTHDGHTHTHKISELEPHIHLHEHTHPELEETYQNMNFH